MNAKPVIPFPSPAPQQHDAGTNLQDLVAPLADRPGGAADLSDLIRGMAPGQRLNYEEGVQIQQGDKVETTTKKLVVAYAPATQEVTDRLRNERLRAARLARQVEALAVALEERSRALEILQLEARARDVDLNESRRQTKRWELAEALSGEHALTLLAFLHVHGAATLEALSRNLPGDQDSFACMARLHNVGLIMYGEHQMALTARGLRALVALGVLEVDSRGD